MSPSVHIAGIGSSPESEHATPAELAVAAGTKALLDAGLTYSSVDHSIACFVDEKDRIPGKCFDVFGKEGAPVSQVDSSAGLFTAVQYIRSGQSECVLVVALEKVSGASKAKQPSAVAIVLVSTQFLTSHAYLKDSSVCIRACLLASQFHSRSANGANEARTARTAVQSALRQARVRPQDLDIVEVEHGGPQQQLREVLGVAETMPQSPNSSAGAIASETRWSGVCRLVYQLRGWTTDVPVQQAKNCLQFTNGEDGTTSVLILARSDGQPAPVWQDIKNVRDGRERLGYNPTVEVRAIAQEDLEAVRAKAEFTSDADLMRLKLPAKGGDRAALARL